MPALLTGLLLGLVFAVPWIVAALWVGSRVGWQGLWSENGEEFPTQAARIRSFGHR